MGVVFRVFNCHLKIALALGGSLEVDDCHVTAHTGSGHVAVCVRAKRAEKRRRKNENP